MEQSVRTNNESHDKYLFVPFCMFRFALSQNHFLISPSLVLGSRFHRQGWDRKRNDRDKRQNGKPVFPQFYWLHNNNNMEGNHQFPHDIELTIQHKKMNWASVNLWNFVWMGDGLTSFILWWNISLLMSVVSSRMTGSRGYLLWE